MKKYIIYIYTNILNNKVYIGQTCLTLEKRAGTNGKKYCKCKYFWNAIQKYGWQSFHSEILEDNSSKNEANEKEVLYISKFNSTNHSYGYNIKIGGNYNNIRTKPVFKYDLNGNYICNYQSISSASEDTGVCVGNISANCLGNQSFAGMFQWSFIKEIKLHPVKINGIPIKVYKYDKNGKYIEQFSSLSDACNSIGILNPTHISDCCYGKRKIAYGYLWRFYKSDLIQPYIKCSNRRKKVYQYTKDNILVKEYNSITDAGNQFSKHAFKHIDSCCNGNQKTAYGFIWSFNEIKF